MKGDNFENLNSVKTNLTITNQNKKQKIFTFPLSTVFDRGNLSLSHNILSFENSFKEDNAQIKLVACCEFRKLAFLRGRQREKQVEDTLDEVNLFS